jgi:glucose/arabinose dehydrogenase
MRPHVLVSASCLVLLGACADFKVDAATAGNAAPSDQGKLDPDNKLIGIAPVPLRGGSYDFDTAEQHGVRAVVIARGLRHPFSIAPLPNGDALVSERSGRLLLLHNASGAGGQASRLDPVPVTGVPQLQPFYMRGALHDVILHPDFAHNRLVYFSFNKAGNPPPADAKPPIRYESRVTLMRGRLADSGLALTDVQELYATESGPSGGSRITFDGARRIYLTTGSPFGNQPQRLDSAFGKVLRLADDGSIPADNPFVARAGARPEIFTYGHRDQLGIATQPESGEVLNAEMGPNGGDEINVLKAGANYGWPLVSFGRQYTGPRWSESPLAPGIELPTIVFLPSIAPFGLDFYRGDRFPRWRGNLLVASVQRGELPHTGSLERIVVNDKLEELRRETLLSDLHQRIGAVRVGQDGLIYVVTDEDDGAVLRIEPSR